MAQHQYYCEECGKHLFDSEKEGGAAGAEATAEGLRVQDDWEKSILQNYEVLPDQMSREAYEKWKREYLAYPKPKED